MDIVAALFFEDLDTNQPFAGGPTRIDLGGIHFSAAAHQPPPVTMAPHMVVLVRSAPDEKGQGALEVRFLRDGEQLARNVQPLQVEPGKFNYRLVRGELEFEEYGTIEAHCRIDMGPATVVPYTLEMAALQVAVPDDLGVIGFDDIDVPAELRQDHDRGIEAERLGNDAVHRVGVLATITRSDRGPLVVPLDT